MEREPVEPVFSHRENTSSGSASGVSATGNRLLSLMPARDWAELALELEEVRLRRSQVLFEPEQLPSHVYFPHAGAMISLVLPLRDGGATETITVGLEGAAGLSVDPTDSSVASFVRGIVQMAGSATRVARSRLAETAAASPALRRVLARHAEAAMSMAMQSVACNGSHPVRARLARWLLIACDRAAPGGQSRDVFLPMTQEFLGEMLNVRRATVSQALLAAQSDGLVRLRRGGVVVIDRNALSQSACECYGAVARRFARLLPSPVNRSDR